MSWLAIFGGVAAKLAAAYTARENAKTDADRIAADVQIKALEGKLASRDNRLIQLGLGIVALAMCGHAAAVAAVSVVPWLGLSIDALPPVYAEMQKSIILSGFGLVAVGKFFR